MAKLVIPEPEVHGTMWPYMHVIIDPSVVKRVKELAALRGYRLGKMVEILLHYALDNVNMRNGHRRKQ